MQVQYGPNLQQKYKAQTCPRKNETQVWSESPDRNQTWPELKERKFNSAKAFGQFWAQVDILQIRLFLVRQILVMSLLGRLIFMLNFSITG